MTKQTGRCLCGKVRFEITKPTNVVGVCHCGMCRRWNGGPTFALQCGAKLVFEGEDNIVRYKSSDWAERGFCGTCGTNLFYHLVASGTYSVWAGALDDQSNLKLTTQIFIDEKPAWYDFANATENMTGAETFAKYAQSDDGGA